MKTIEEKAKAYDEAKLRMSAAYNSNRCTIGFMNEIFPEFKESERIRKAIIEHFEGSHSSMYPYKGFTKEQILAWLEKQKEPELSEDLGEYITELSKQFPEVSFAKLSRIAVRVKNWLEKQGEQKPWSEEDKNAIQVLKNIVRHSDEIDENIYTMPLKEKLYDWLKSLKDRVQPQPKRELSKEDEKEVAVLEAYIRSKDWSEKHIDRALGIVDELVNKVKSLRPQNRWKPSDEQMKALQEVIDVGYFTSYPNSLETLYEQLKKLKG